MAEPTRLPMNVKFVKRITGFLMLISAIGYIVGWYIDYDIPNYNLPTQIQSPAFIIGYVSVLIYMFWPMDDPYVGNGQDVNLLPDRQPAFNQALAGTPAALRPAQSEWAQEPMEHQGTIVASRHDGSWWMLVNGEWVQYA